MTDALLTDADASAFRLERPAGSSPYLLVCDHASRVLPRRLGNLGLSPEELTSHVAWDIGIAEVTLRLSQRLDACAVLQNYSRLVIDANRPTRTPQSIIALSERTHVPGNQGLTANDIEQREREIFTPYHECIRTLLDGRSAARVPAALCSMHSFTPSFMDVSRPWHAGVLYNRDPRLGRALRSLMLQEPGLVIGDNQPYSVSDETDYTVVVHAERRGIPYLELEIRQDLIADAAGQTAWAERLARLLPQLLADVVPN
jgi:predicted N-formylglutamate amidohydrolase